MSPVDNFWRSPLTTVVVPERKLFELAEKPRPIPPTRPAKNAFIVKLPSRLTTSPRTPVLPPNAMKPLNSLSAYRPTGCGEVIFASFTYTLLDQRLRRESPFTRHTSLRALSALRYFATKRAGPPQ